MVVSVTAVEDAVGAKVSPVFRQEILWWLLGRNQRALVEGTIHLSSNFVNPTPAIVS